MPLPQKYYAHGKLLITGEYAVLDGALALAFPTKMGQWLELDTYPNPKHTQWNSFDVHQQIWFSCLLSEDLHILKTNDTEKAKRLLSLLHEVIVLSPSFKNVLQGTSVHTRLEFDRHWGLGSSSTLIQLLSQWADINPYLLLKNSFKGSGYDIACASANGPILYQLIHDTPQITPISFPTEFLSNGYFVYLGNKQLSDQEIKKYSELKFDRELLRQQITEITNQLAQVNNGVKFCALLEKHEDLISQAIGYPKVKDRLFPTIKGTFKSLGAWGGDFVLFIGTESQIQKIKKMGYSTILPWSDMLRLN